MSRNTDAEWNALAHALCFKNEEHMWRVLYTEEGLSVAEIAERLKAGTATCNRRMAQFKIPKRGRGGGTGTKSKQYVLFHLDQRIVMGLVNKVLADRFDCSVAVIYHYKTWKYGGDSLGYAMNYKGGEVTNTQGMPHC